MMSLARWVVCAGEQFDDRHYRQEVHQLEQDLLRKALEHGFDEEIFGCQTSGDLALADFEDGESRAWKALRVYDAEVFLQELLSGFAPIAAKRQAGEAAWRSMSDNEKLAEVCLQENRILQSIEDQGLGCLMMTSALPAE